MFYVFKVDQTISIKARKSSTMDKGLEEHREVLTVATSMNGGISSTLPVACASTYWMASSLRSSRSHAAEAVVAIDARRNKA